MICFEKTGHIEGKTGHIALHITLYICLLFDSILKKSCHADLHLEVQKITFTINI